MELKWEVPNLGSLKLPSLDPFNYFDSLGKKQGQNDLVATLSINKERLGEGITSREKSEWDDPNDNRNVFDLVNNRNKDNDG